MESSTKTSGRFWSVLQKVVQSDPAEKPHAEKLRAAITWLFNLARNILMVGALKYFADKTHNVTLQIAYVFSAVALAIFISTYWASWQINIFTLFKSARWALILDAIINAAFVAFMLAEGFPTVSAIASAIAKAQGH